MSDEIVFDRGGIAPTGTVSELSPLVRRIVAGNAGPMTFTGTCSYIVGRGRVAIIDPGPDRPDHVAALLAAVAGETVTDIVVTHTHRDHSPAVKAVKAATGARVVGCGVHRPARALALGELNPLEGAADHDYAPEHEMRSGDSIGGPGWTLTALATPGHTANHLAFALPQEATLFSGDHVMAWSTSVIAPPDGSMAEFMSSLQRLQSREQDALYWPGHGGPVREPQRFLRGLLQHRRQREAAIMNRLQAGDDTIPAMVAAIYQSTPPALHGAAGLSVLAQLEDLVERGLVVASETPPQLDSRFRLA